MTTTDDKTQTNSPHGPYLTLDVENFGPIAEAKNIEFKPMTVLVGPSNTGKTYLAVLLHAFLQTNSAASRISDPIEWVMSNPSIANSTNLRKFLEDYVRVYTHLKTQGVAEPKVLFSHLSPSSQSFLRPFIDSRVNLIFQSLVNNIKDYFEIDDVSAMSPCIDFRNPSIAFNLSFRGSKIIFDLNREKAIPDLSGYELDLDPNFADFMERQMARFDTSTNDEAVLSFELLTSVMRTIVDYVPRTPASHYFPTGRSGIMNGHRVFTSEIISNAHLHGIDRRGSTTYHRIAREFLRDLVNIRQKPRRNTLRSDANDGSEHESESVERIASVIEDSVMGGSVQISDTIGLPDFRFLFRNNSIPMFRASSAATELAPVAMFLRNYVTIGDLLIIDEPEAHLHPAAQQQMAAALAFMVRSGLRVLITTHSHYMVEQLSAFVNASKLDQTTRKRALALDGTLGEEDIYLNEDETAVYNFRLSSEHGGSVVEEVFMGDEFEYGTDDHTDAVTDQFNRLQRVLEAREKVEFGELD